MLFRYINTAKHPEMTMFSEHKVHRALTDMTAAYTPLRTTVLDFFFIFRTLQHHKAVPTFSVCMS